MNNHYNCLDWLFKFYFLDYRNKPYNIEYSYNNNNFRII